MADKIPANDKAAKPADDAKPAAAPAGMKSVLVSSLVLAVVLGAVGFVLAYFVLPARVAGQLQAATAPSADPAAPIVKEHVERNAKDVAAQGNKQVTKFTIEEVTVNIADTRGNRFVRAGVFFEAPPAVLEELEANRARMVDTLEQVLSAKTLDQLTSPSVRGTLREELLGIINPTLKEGRVDNIYFTDLLVQ